MRRRTRKMIATSAIASLALFGAACDDSVEEDMGDIGNEVESEVEQGVDDAADDAAEGE